MPTQNSFFMVSGWFLWFHVRFLWFYKVPVGILIVLWFLEVPGWFFMVPGGFELLFKVPGLVFHGFMSVFIVH